MGRVYVNGKFLAQRGTGVQRSARQWLEAVDAWLDQGRGRSSWVLLHPPGVRPPRWRAIEARTVGRAGWPLHAWEQWALPRAARDGLLLNLAGSAPWFARAQIATLHDAAVFDQPQAYTRAFRWWYRSLFRHLARGSGRLLTVSEFSRQRLASALGVPAGRLEVVPNGGDHFERLVADRRVLSELGLAGQPYLLAVASANPTKNLARLVSAFGQLSSSAIDLRLVLVGGINRRVFASAGGALSTPGLVQAGAVDDARLKALYEQALGLVLPSVYEGFGLPALEAMSCGCPVIAAQAAALPEICGEAALYVDPLSSDQLAEAMARLAADSGIRNDLRVAGRRRVAQFGWQEAGRQLLELVEAAASTTSD